MRILYDHQLFSLQNVGGASRYHYELMRYLATIPDVASEIFLGVNQTTYPFLQLSSPRTSVLGVRAPLPRGMVCYLLNEALENAISPFRGKVDVYHPTYYRCLPMVRSRRIVATHHDCTHERFPHLFPDVKKVLWARKKLFPEMDAIICVSESARNDLVEFYDVDPAKTRVIYHGVSPLTRCPGAAKTLHEQLRREYLLYVGIRASFKNFNGLLRAFYETGLKDSMDLLVLGGGPLTADEKDLIAEWKMSDSVISMPRVSDGLLAEAYAGARLFVYPSWNEGFGFPPLEAMTLGCPVLATNRSSVPEICHDAPFYFDPADQESFNDALLRAVHDEDDRKQAVERGRKVVAKYSWERCGQETLALYRECQ